MKKAKYIFSYRCLFPHLFLTLKYKKREMFTKQTQICMPVGWKEYPFLITLLQLITKTMLNTLLVFRSKVLWVSSPSNSCRLWHAGILYCTVIPAAPWNKEKAPLTSSSSCSTSCCLPLWAEANRSDRRLQDSQELIGVLSHRLHKSVSLS